MRVIGLLAAARQDMRGTALLEVFALGSLTI